VKRLIINADDFGLTLGVNHAIREAHENGILTSATLMASGAAFSNAVEISRSTPQLSVGCHIVLIDGSPVLDPARVPSLVNGKSLEFRSGINNFAIQSFFGRLNENEIEAEATAQIRKLQSAGVVVSHIDTHKHTHIFPRVLRPLLHAAKVCGVKAVRNPFEPIRMSLFVQRPSLWKRLAQVKLLGNFSQIFHDSIKEAGMVSPDGSLSIAATGAVDEKLFRSMLENIPEGTWEFVSHPGYNDPELQTVRTRLRESRAQELNILTSAAAREIIASSGIELISYRDLAGNWPKTAVF